MKTDLLKFALAFLAISIFLANCADAQKIPVDKSGGTDLSTDAGIIAELQKIIGGKNAESTGDEKLDAKRKAANKLEAKDVCIERLKESAKIIVIGFFRNDYGCHFEGAFVGSRYFDATKEISELSKAALEELGWKKANQKARENLAKLWVEKALLVFAPLANQTLSAISASDGKIKVTASSKYPPGVTSRTETKTFVFGKDGELFSGSSL
jgi:hypothetical protein